MRKYQKYILPVLLLFIVVSVVVLGKYYGNWNVKKVVSAEQMEEYGRTYLREYEYLVQSKVIPTYQKYFTFLKEKPILIKASISTTQGAAIEFIPSEKRDFQCRIVSARIEQEIFPDHEFDAPRINFDSNNIAVNYKGPPRPMFRAPQGIHKGIGNIISDCRFITNKGWCFIELSEDSSELTKNVIIDDVVYPNTIIIKGNNRKSSWSRKAAKEDAPDEFYSDFQQAYFTSEEFREFVAMPELTQIATEIIAKEKNGEYGGQYGYFKKIEDLTKLDTVADVHRIKHEFTKNYLAFLKEQPNWWERHRIIRYLTFTFLGTILGAFLLWFVKWVWQKLSLSQRFSAWWCKKKISN